MNIHVGGATHTVTFVVTDSLIGQLKNLQSFADMCAKEYANQSGDNATRFVVLGEAYHFHDKGFKVLVSREGDRGPVESIASAAIYDAHCRLAQGVATRTMLSLLKEA